MINAPESAATSISHTPGELIERLPVSRRLRNAVVESTPNTTEELSSEQSTMLSRYDAVLRAQIKYYDRISANTSPTSAKRIMVSDDVRVWFEEARASQSSLEDLIAFCKNTLYRNILQAFGGDDWTVHALHQTVRYLQQPTPDSGNYRLVAFISSPVSSETIENTLGLYAGESSRGPFRRGKHKNCIVLTTKGLPAEALWYSEASQYNEHYWLETSDTAYSDDELSMLARRMIETADVALFETMPSTDSATYRFVAKLRVSAQETVYIPEMPPHSRWSTKLPLSQPLRSGRVFSAEELEFVSRKFQEHPTLNSRGLCDLVMLEIKAKDFADDIPPRSGVKREIRNFKRQKDIEKTSSRDTLPYLDAYWTAKVKVLTHVTTGVQVNAGEELFRRADAAWASWDKTKPLPRTGIAQQILREFMIDFTCDVNILVIRNRLDYWLKKSKLKPLRENRGNIMWTVSNLRLLRSEIERLWAAKTLTSWSDMTLGGVLFATFSERGTPDGLTTKISEVRKRAAESSKNNVEKTLEGLDLVIAEVQAVENAKRSGSSKRRKLN